ncbi:GNAT family N-acetyltransferase [Legionella oakridgensis]|uniref:GNAT family N-acetyltransferase n=1 Tax=Legionella oakridgensis TaxID=29423 RepID=UPI0003DE11C9|nr:acetyltransferase (GNAT) domain protein [Legionella oakridgensis RV-2-2007]
MDLFIAEDRARNKGLGVQMIQQFIGEFLTKFQAIIVDPQTNHAQAIRCYEKVDFKRTEFSEDENYL